MIDSHQHFWVYTETEYPWMGPSMGPLRRDFLPCDLLVELKVAGFEGSVAVQARQSLVETNWLLALARENTFIKGVVGWVDLKAPDVDVPLRRLSSDPKLCGVRHVVHDEPDDRFILHPDFMRGLSRLKPFGLTYDLLLFPRHLPVALEVVRHFPEQPFVIDHMAKPLVREGRVEPWARDIRELAKHPNVFCKVSGLVTEADWRRWKPSDFHPYLDVVFEAFGPRRLMMGSDWPVCRLAASFVDVTGLVKEYVAHLSPDDQAAVLGETATRFYGLDGRREARR